jgi:organic radical activating enzyme
MYRVNDIFYSLQGEGHNTGRAAVFIRFAGCNLRCSFCDTEFDTYREMTAEEIVASINTYSARFVVLTGGEPTLQVDEAFVDLLHQYGFEVAMESNGTRPAPKNLDWLTVSPKISGEKWKVESGWRLPDEVKVVFDEDTVPETYLPSPSTLSLSPILYLQPCDTGNAERNAIIINRCIDYIKEHPQWRLSLQTHKLIGFK